MVEAEKKVELGGQKRKNQRTTSCTFAMVE